MSITETWHIRTTSEAACNALKKNGFEARFAETGAEALAYIESLITPGISVGTGGSVTLRALGVQESLERLGAKVLDHGKKGLTADEKMDLMRAQLTCDLFISSSNAVTLDGEIFNIDGNGNRVAALTFGPKKTVVVVGYNKIVRDLAEAETRCETIASPMNNKRLETRNPCTKTGICVDCTTENRICKIYSILKRRPRLSDFTVIIVGERLGY